MPDLWLLLGIVFVAGLIQGVAGFGFGLVSMGVLILIMSVQDAAVVVAIIALFSASLNLWTVRHDVPWRETWPVLATALPFASLGVYLLRVLDASVLRIGVAAMILTGCAVALITEPSWREWLARWRARRGQPVPPRVRREFPACPSAYIAGIVGGVFGGSLGMGGPPVVLYTLLRDWDKCRCKGLMSAYFVVSGIWRVAMLGIQGVATVENVRLGALLLIPALAAAFLGTRVFQRMSTQVFRYATLALLVGLAGNLIF